MSYNGIRRGVGKELSKLKLAIGDKQPITIELANGLRIQGIAIVTFLQSSGCYQLHIPNCHIIIDAKGSLVNKIDSSECGAGTIGANLLIIQEPLTTLEDSKK